MDSVIKVFLACGDVLQGSYFEVLFHQLSDGAVPKLASDRLLKVDGQNQRVSLTTDSGLAHYPARLNDMYKQADVVVLLYNTKDRKVFEGLKEQIDFIIGPLRDFSPATIVLLGVVQAGSADAPHVISPQEVSSICSQFSAFQFELDLNVSRKELDDLWFFLVRSYKVTFQSSSSRSQAMLREEVLTPLLTTLITKKEWNQELAKALAVVSLKKNDKLFKAALKASGKTNVFNIAPFRIDLLNVQLLTQTYATVTITNTTKGPLNWTVVEPDHLSSTALFVCLETGGSLAKGKSATITFMCVFFQPSELNRFVLIECPQEPGLFAPIFVRCAAPLQPRDPKATWVIDRKAISIGFRISSTLSANVYRSTLYGAVVAVKEFTLGPDGRPPEIFFSEWEAFVKLKHPNIAQFLGGDENAGFMVLEYLKHGQLGTFLHNPPPRGVVRTIDLRLKMATDLAKALAYLHSQKMLHRDLTSANVLVDADCSVKLGDFGEPRSLSAQDTTIGEIGSLDWTAPELITANEVVHNQKTDIFSFGVILWEFGAERIPARTMVDVRNGVLPGLPMEIKTRYPAFAELVAHCTHIDPEVRPSFDEIVERLENIRSAGPTSYTPAPVAKTAPKAEPPRYIPNSLPDVSSPVKSNPALVRPPASARMPPPPMQTKVESVILPEMSLGPDQLGPPISPHAAMASLFPNAPAPSMQKMPIRNESAVAKGPSPNSGIVSPRNVANPGLPAPPSAKVKSPPISARTPGSTSGPKFNPPKYPGSTLNALISPRGDGLPEAVPLVAPGRAPAGSFVPPVNLAPPPLSMTDTGTPVAQAVPLLRMPSMSKYGQPPPMGSGSTSPTTVFNPPTPKSPNSPPSSYRVPLKSPTSPVSAPAQFTPPLPRAKPPATPPVGSPTSPRANPLTDNIADWSHESKVGGPTNPSTGSLPSFTVPSVLPPSSISSSPSLNKITSPRGPSSSRAQQPSGSGNTMAVPHFESPFENV